MHRRKRLGELPRACSLTDLPVQIVKDHLSPDVVSSWTRCDPRGRHRRARASHRGMELMGIEPTTSGLQNRRSPKLSYSPLPQPRGERHALQPREQSSFSRPLTAPMEDAAAHRNQSGPR
jgi:hypothetical protein